MIKLKKTSKYGRGLYASKDIKKGQIVETSPVIVLDRHDVTRVSATVINVYVFGWGDGYSALALGNGSLFNHAKKSNISYINNYLDKSIVFVATKNVKKGRQLFINYGYDPKHGLEVTRRNKERVMDKSAIHPIPSPSPQASSASELT